MTKIDRPSKLNRVMFNTTIEADTLMEFKTRCKDMGIPINTILEAFMKQFVNNEFEMKLNRSGKAEVELVL